MKLTDERLNHLAHLVVDGIWNEDLVDYTDEDMAMRVARKSALDFGQSLSEIDKFARDRVASLKRNVIEGSPEWDVLYNKYYEEELSRRGKS